MVCQSATCGGADARPSLAWGPRPTGEQLARMLRLRDVRRKDAVSVRLDPQVMEGLRGKGEGHLIRINDILLNLMEAERAMGGGR